MPKPVQASTYTFRKIIDGGFLYVDKTEYLYRLVRPASGVYFLARPRRFGKSLMISTLEEIKLLKEQQHDVTQLNNPHLRELAFSTYEIETLSIVPLLFQTGYLTIKDYEPTRRMYRLAYPNTEVEDAFLTYLLGDWRCHNGS
ncbi:MAG: AAA family ATPase [Caldilineaceae bacterium]